MTVSRDDRPFAGAEPSTAEAPNPQPPIGLTVGRRTVNRRVVTAPNRNMYRISLQDFEGPLDLLLFFIRRDELDVFDIPIAKIADEYLEYVRLLEQIDLDSVGDFLYMAAVLINIKARMLLPKEELDEEGEPIDPRRELVERLLEYVRFKEASANLTELESERSDRFTRGHAAAERDRWEDRTEVEYDASVFDLISALKTILTEAPDEPTHAVAREEYSIEEQQEFILARLEDEGKLSFARTVKGRSKSFIITTFLGVLELARQQRVGLLVPEGEALDFYLEHRDAPDDEGEAGDGEGAGDDDGGGSRAGAEGTLPDDADGQAVDETSPAGTGDKT